MFPLLQKRKPAFLAPVGYYGVTGRAAYTGNIWSLGFIIQLIREQELRMIPELCSDPKIIPCPDL